MPNLFWKKSNRITVNVAEKPFVSEEELETYLSETSELLSDIYIFKRQVRGNSGQEIPDLIGIDKENNVVLLELKNTLVNEDIAPQVLRYAIWAETHPDSLKALWLEYEDKPDDVDVNWDALSIRIVIVAPEYKTTVPKMISKIDYDVDLLEIKRFALEKNEFVSIKSLDKEKGEIGGVTRAQEVYDESFYKNNFNKKSVENFLKIAKQIDRYQTGKGWNLTKKFNRNYIGFKHGFFNVFGVKWLGSRSFGVFFKIQEKLIKKIVTQEPLKYRDDSQWGELVYRVDQNIIFNPNNLNKLFTESYRKVVGLD